LTRAEGCHFRRNQQPHSLNTELVREVIILVKLDWLYHEQLVVCWIAVAKLSDEVLATMLDAVIRYHRGCAENFGNRLST
jgi:hypothetical protein